MKQRPLFQSFNYAIEGIIHALRTQRNIRIHFLVAGLVLLLALILGMNSTQLMLLIFAIALVIVAELLNTAIETAIDISTTTFDPLAKASKDVAAAAVLVATLAAVAIGYLVFFSRLNSFTLKTLEKVRNSPVHISAITLFLVIIVVIAAKAWTGTGSFLRGGWPSGHSALAGSLFTSISLISRNAILATLAFIMALLVFQSRREAKFHSFLEIIAGAVLGILATVIIFQLFFRF